ncbi:MAG: 4Fe-4S dicluster domain-containing protein [Desulfobacterales bacterium]|jgi:tetrathionate reductase subunit B|nr:4Fe-4S dicluster domain-containing protein [Desulfobacterales bacterium]
MKTQLAMVIDSSVCIDCKGCTVACKVENRVPEGHWRNWVKQDVPNVEEMFNHPKKARLHFQPGGCMHCENATCVQACPTGATYKNHEDGTVQVNKKLCIGCGSCIPACPYGARYRHPVEKVVDKCDFCAARRARGELPACVTTCPTKARTFGDINDPKSDTAILLKKHASIRVINAATDTKPNMYYLSQTAPMNWPQPAKEPTPIGWLKSLYPVVWALVGFNALGVLAMLGKQLISKDEASPPAHEPAKGGKND